jgi:hypothetical protein
MTPKSKKHAHDHAPRFGDGIGIPQKRVTAICGARVIPANCVHIGPDPTETRGEPTTCTGCSAILAERLKEESHAT